MKNVQSLDGITAKPTSLPTPALSALALSPDIWSNVMLLLPVKDLMSLSQTCHTLYLTATTEYQFRHRVSRFSNDKRHVPWSIQFRRYCAIRQAPEKLPLIGMLHNPDNHLDPWPVFIGTVASSLILYNASRGLLVGFPGEWTRNVGLNMSERCIMVGKGAIAIIHGTAATVTKLELLNACDGETISITDVAPSTVSACTKFNKTRLRRPQVAMSAGTRGDHCMFVCNRDITVLSLADGTVTRRWNLDGEGDIFPYLVRADDGGWYSGESDRGMRVVALVRKSTFLKRDKSKQTYTIVDLIDASPWSHFCISIHDKLVDVVASIDKRCTARRVALPTRRTVVCISKKSGSDWVDSYENAGRSRGTFSTASCEFSMAHRGREVTIFPIGLSTVGDERVDGRIFRIWNGLDGLHVDNLKGVQRVGAGAFNWAECSGDGRVLFACSRQLGMVSIFEMNSGRCLRTLRWNNSFREICLVGNHWLVAITITGKLCVWHFGEYCHHGASNYDGSGGHSANPDTQGFLNDNAKDRPFAQFGVCHSLFRIPPQHEDATHFNFYTKIQIPTFGSW